MSNSAYDVSGQHGHSGVCNKNATQGEQAFISLRVNPGYALCLKLRCALCLELDRLHLQS